MLSTDIQGKENRSTFFEHVYERWPHKISVMSHKQTQNRPNIKIEVTGAILMLEGQTVSAESR